MTLALKIIHVSTQGDDANDGVFDRPFRTISAAAKIALPGDTVLVQEGIYREQVDPPRAGRSPIERITYRACDGQRVIITGSEPVHRWTHVRNDTWQAIVPNTLFGAFNPFADVIRGDWFNPKGRQHHTAAVYLNDEWLIESESKTRALAPTDGPATWFAEVHTNITLVWAQFPGVDPNEQQVEINVRRAAFYPSRTGVDYIAIEGFEIRNTATPWAPPTAEQIGAIGTNWSKGWLIKGNRIRHSRCSGISLGKYGDQFDNTSQNSAEGYVYTVLRAQFNGWKDDLVGHHVVENNHISHCEQAGIVGSLGCSRSRITGNHIHDIHVIRDYCGAEQSGIKLHGAVDVEISSNHIHDCYRGIWLDWMAQGTRVVGNLLHDNLTEDLYLEVNHGPFLVANNIFLSRQALDIWSNGGAYVHNLVAGSVQVKRDPMYRWIPFLKPFSTEMHALKMIGVGDDRWINNLFVGAIDMSVYADADLPVAAQGNVYVGVAWPIPQEVSPKIINGEIELPFLESSPQGWSLTNLQLVLPEDGTKRSIVDSETLGVALSCGQGYGNADGTVLRLDFDYNMDGRQADSTAVGPFDQWSKESHLVWPIFEASSGLMQPRKS